MMNVNHRVVCSQYVSCLRYEICEKSSDFQVFSFEYWQSVCVRVFRLTSFLVSGMEKSLHWGIPWIRGVPWKDITTLRQIFTRNWRKNGNSVSIVRFSADVC